MKLVPTRCREEEDQEEAERVPVAELPAPRRRFLVQADAVAEGEANRSGPSNGGT